MTIRKAVTFRASSLGDALNAKYLFENIHVAYPEARCAIVVAGREAMIRDLLAGYPWIEVVEANRKNIRSLIALWRAFRGSDLVVIPPVKAGSTFSFPSKIAARLLARRGALIGFADASGGNAFIYDRVMPLRPEQAPRLSEQDVLHALEIPVSVENMRFKHMPQPGLLNRLNLDGRPYIVVHLFAGTPMRGISQQKRQELIDALARALPGVPIALTGTHADRPYIEQLSLPAEARICAGELSVQELAAVMAQSACVVSIGSGPSHIASSLGVPVLVMVTCAGVPWVGKAQYGENVRVHIFSDTAACAKGHDHSQPYPACIEGIDVEAVAQAAAAYIA